MICYVVIDINILVSSLLTSNKINKVFDNELIPIFNKLILDEYDEVLIIKKIKFNIYLVDNFLNQIRKLGKLIEANLTK